MSIIGSQKMNCTIITIISNTAAVSMNSSTPPPAHKGVKHEGRPTTSFSNYEIATLLLNVLMRGEISCFLYVLSDEVSCCLDTDGDVYDHSKSEKAFRSRALTVLSQSTVAAIISG